MSELDDLNAKYQEALKRWASEPNNPPEGMTAQDVERQVLEARYRPVLEHSIGQGPARPHLKLIPGGRDEK